MQVLCIVGDSRSGSTLLQALLCRRPGVVGLGELRRLELFWSEGRDCACGQPITDCGFWRNIVAGSGIADRRPRTQPPARRLGKLLGEAAAFAGYVTNMRRVSRLLLPHGRRVTADLTGIYRAVAGQTGATVLVDASKDPGHYLYLDQLSDLDVHPVLLIRDGRAVVWSKIRRTGIDPQKAIDHWARVTRMQLALSQRQRPQRPTLVHYETICQSPVQVLDQLAAGGRPSAVGGDVEPRDRHHIGGAPDFLLNADEAPRIDLRWVDEMPNDVLTLFERRAGRLNAQLGYRSGRTPGFAETADDAIGIAARPSAWPMVSAGGR